MTSTLSLASRLAALSDDELVALLRARAPKGRIDDYFDLAEALLEHASVQAALARLDRSQLSALAAVILDGDSEGVDAAQRAHLRSLAELALVEPVAVAEKEPGYLAYDAVRERLEAWPGERLPSLQELREGNPPTALTIVAETDLSAVDRLAAERAFQTVGSFAELLVELDREPARELQKGGLSLPDGRRLAVAMSVEPEAVVGAMWLAEHAGLVALDGSAWLTSESAEAWLAGSTAERWRGLAAAWVQALPSGIRTLLRERAHMRWGATMHDTLGWFYPAAGEPLAREVAKFQAAAELLGISADDVPSDAGIALLEQDADAAAATIATQLPAEVDKVYLQHDLTIVSPGPLAPDVDARLRILADVESRALASSYRVSAASIERAIARGETAQSLRDFLTEVSLTGIPQPLDYLIAEAEQRYGLVRVRSTGHGTHQRTSIRSAATDLVSAILVDQAFTPLALERESDIELSSRFPRDVVYWALADAKYPVVAENASGHIEGVRKRRARIAATPAAPDRTAELIERLRRPATAEAAQSPQAWLSRQLEAAVRGRVALLVTIALPDGSEHELLLEPTGVGGGRLRGRDRRSDIERTLPLSSIVSVRTP